MLHHSSALQREPARRAARQRLRLSRVIGGRRWLCDNERVGAAPDDRWRRRRPPFPCPPSLQLVYVARAGFEEAEVPISPSEMAIMTVGGLKNHVNSFLKWELSASAFWLALRGTKTKLGATTDPLAHIINEGVLKGVRPILLDVIMTGAYLRTQLRVRAACCGNEGAALPCVAAPTGDKRAACLDAVDACPLAYPRKLLSGPQCPALCPAHTPWLPSLRATPCTPAQHRPPQRRQRVRDRCGCAAPRGPAACGARPPPHSAAEPRGAHAAHRSRSRSRHAGASMCQALRPAVQRAPPLAPCAAHGVPTAAQRLPRPLRGGRAQRVPAAAHRAPCLPSRPPRRALPPTGGVRGADGLGA